MPSRIVLLVKLLLDIGSNVFFDVEFLHCLSGYLNSILLYVFRGTTSINDWAVPASMGSLKKEKVDSELQIATCPFLPLFNTILDSTIVGNLAKRYTPPSCTAHLGSIEPVETRVVGLLMLGTGSKLYAPPQLSTIKLDIGCEY